jgi:hypothetical protein
VEIAQAVGAAAQGGLGDRAEGAAQHHGAAQLGGGDVGGAGDGLDHDAVQGALAQLAGEQADQEPLLVAGGAGEQVAQEAAPLGLGAGAGLPADPLEGGVDLADGERGGGGRRGQVAQGRVADADLALAQLPGEEGDRDADLVRLQAAQAAGEAGDLAEPRGCGRDRLGGRGELAEQHGTKLAPSSRVAAESAFALPAGQRSEAGSTVAGRRRSGGAARPRPPGGVERVYQRPARGARLLEAGGRGPAATAGRTWRGCPARVRRPACG